MEHGAASMEAPVPIDFHELGLADITGMRRLIRKFGSECSMLSIFETRLDMHHFQKTLNLLFEKGMASGVVAEAEGRVIGVLLYTVSPNLFTGEDTAHEVVWFVDPEYRDRSVGARLYSRGLKQVKASGCTYMVMVHLETSMPEELKSFYLRQGYTFMESTYQMRL